MQVHLPVSGREQRFPAGPAPVWITDPNGVIRYCNPAFFEVCGYERSELLGQPQALLRHPDMPEKAFRDMAPTLAAGRPWPAVLKTRRKDGGHCWVTADVTPLIEGDRTIGWLSVCTEPTPDQIAAAEELHARLRDDGRARQLQAAELSG